jgi:hypothetical protein
VQSLLLGLLPGLLLGLLLGLLPGLLLMAQVQRRRSLLAARGGSSCVLLALGLLQLLVAV